MTHVFTFRTRDGLLIVEVRPKGMRPGARTYVATMTTAQDIVPPSKRFDYALTVEAKHERQYTEGPGVSNPEEIALDLIQYVYDCEPEALI